jgi:hypothetical protein
MRRALMWLNLYGRQVVRHKSPKRAKNTKKAVLALFRAYVGQPDGHIGWVTLMPFASINPTNPRTNLWNLATIAQLLGVVERLSFFESAILNLFFCFILIQISHNLWDTKNFFEILMITLISSKNLGGDRNMNNTVHTIQSTVHSIYGGFHLHLLVFPFVYQFSYRIGVLVHSLFAND